MMNTDSKEYKNLKRQIVAFIRGTSGTGVYPKGCFSRSDYDENLLSTYELADHLVNNYGFEYIVKDGFTQVKDLDKLNNLRSSLSGSMHSWLYYDSQTTVFTQPITLNSNNIITNGDLVMWYDSDNFDDYENFNYGLNLYSEYDITFNITDTPPRSVYLLKDNQRLLLPNINIECGFFNKLSIMLELRTTVDITITMLLNSIEKAKSRL